MCQRDRSPLSRAIAPTGGGSMKFRQENSESFAAPRGANVITPPCPRGQRREPHRKRCVNSEVIDCEKSLLTECSSATVTPAGHSRGIPRSDWSPARCRRFRTVGTRRDARDVSIVRRSLILLRVDPHGTRGPRENFIAFTISVNDASTRQCVPRHNAAAIGAPDYAD